MFSYLKKIYNRFKEPELLDTIEESRMKKTKTEIIVMCSAIFVVTMTMLGTSYAIFSSVQKSENYNTIKTGDLEITFTNGENGVGNILNLNGAYPVSDETGLMSEPYYFKITNTGSLGTEYTIKILDDDELIAEDGCSDNLLPKENIKVSLNHEKPFLLSSRADYNYIIDGTTLESGGTRDYTVQIWIDESSDNNVLGTHYHGKIRVDAINTNHVED